MTNTKQTSQVINLVWVIFFFFKAESPGQQNGDEDKIEAKTRKKGQVELIDKEDIQHARAFDCVLDYHYLYHAGYQAADDKGQDGAPDSGFVAFEIIDHDDGRDGQQV